MRHAPRILVWVLCCEYERASITHALTALGAVAARVAELTIVAHVQTQEREWPELTALLTELRRRTPHHYAAVYWWDAALVAPGPGHERLAGITASRNQALLLARGAPYDAVWYVDADVLVPEDAFLRLWALDQPLTSGVFWSTAADGVPYVFCRDLYRAEQGLAATPGGGYDCHYIRWLPEQGIVPADFVGNGCLLWRGDALASGLTYTYGWRHQDQRYWAEDPFTLLDALDMGLGPVYTDVSVNCWHTRPDGLAVRGKETRRTAELLTEARQGWSKPASMPVEQVVRR
ncbi:MAG: glycosyltransferase family A protein [Thermomicrobiales bacterium]